MKSSNILICFGTRPEWLKVKPLIRLMNKESYKLLFTGHLTICNTPNNLSNIFDELNKNPYIAEECPYGDGKSSEEVLKILYEEGF